MKISVIQTKRVFAYEVLDPGEFDLARCRCLSQIEMDEGFALIEEAGRRQSNLVVTIEGFNESASPRDPRYDVMEIVEPLDGPVASRFGALARKYSMYIVAGLYTGRDGKAYNSGILYGPDGTIVGFYDKVHHPYADGARFASGDTYPVFETEFGNIGILICWDMQYPEAVREVALRGADLIAVPTQGWEPIWGYARAYENCVSLAVAMYVPAWRPQWDDCDPSCIVDNMGKIVAAAGRDGSQVVTAELDIRQEPVPQYGAEAYTGMPSMRQIRMMQRRPETYRLANDPHPPVVDRYSATTGLDAADRK